MITVCLQENIKLEQFNVIIKVRLRETIRLEQIIIFIAETIKLGHVIVFITFDYKEPSS